MVNKQPLVSIITVAYNAADTIADTIRSVINQDYSTIEYIIVDGASKDNTLEIIDGFGDQIAKVLSEPDQGIYDGMNKGLDLATGEIVGILNSDDFYANNQVITNVVKTFDPQTKGVYADLDYVDPLAVNKIIRHWKSGSYEKGSFKKGWMPPHPTFFVKKEVYDQYGKFSLELKSAADYELMLRFIHKHEIAINYLPETIIKMRTGGMSNASFKNRLNANREDKKAWEMNGLKPGALTFVRKPLSKIIQYIKR